MRRDRWETATRKGRRRAAGFAIAVMVAAAVGAALSGCASPPPPATGGRFALEDFFRGDSVSQGEIRTLAFWREDFTASFSGASRDGTLRLDERFHFADGERLQRWRLKRVAPDRYEGTVETENGSGVLSAPVPVDGYPTGDGAVLSYDGFAPGGGGLLLHFRHWMEAQPDGSVLNRVRISKFGLPIAGARVVFSRASPTG